MKAELTDRPHLAIQHLRNLHQEKISSPLEKDLLSFTTAKPRSLDVFTEGVLLFTKIANFSPSQRVDYYGSQFQGLHYNNDLAKLWNLSSSDSVKAHQLNPIRPSGWDYVLEDSYVTLVYRGDNPSRALDKLLQGPTVIDCGMFCQLSIWFGIKYMLGEKAFNEVFGRAPFYLTQIVYSATPPQKPYMGNPLYPFFQEVLLEKEDSSSTISIAHVHNHPLYLLKHPGGSYGSDNCVVIGSKFIIFDPTLETTSNLSRSDVEELLLQKFNAEQDVNDEARLALYKQEESDATHPKFGMNYRELIKMAESLSDFKAENIELDSQATSPQIKFNFDLFCSWVREVQSPAILDVAYSPLLDSELVLSQALVDLIPYENRTHMSFSNFTVGTSLQQEMIAISKKFCLDVMSGRSVCVILTGKAGIGKTASAVSCAKELAGRGKHVIWISEVMSESWMDKAESMKKLEVCRDEVQKLLASRPDAVFLDDDNLVGYAGRVLLEEIYRWYVTTPGTGLFVTSNEPVTFKACYGFKLDKKYHFPPFPGYCSPQYRNTLVRSDMSGKCMRARSSLDIMKISAPDRIIALTQCQSESSVGIIVDAKSYEAQKSSFSDVELVPAFPKEAFFPMTQSLMKDGTLGPAYDALSPDQKKYTKRFPVYKYENINGRLCHTGIFWYFGIYVKAFCATQKKMIVVELLDDIDLSGKEIIQGNCLDQLLRVINYAHDSGGKRIVFLNNTKFSDTEMLSKIKEGISPSEKEKTFARIDALLFSPKLEIPEQREKTTTTMEMVKQPSLRSVLVVRVSSPHALFFSSSDTMRKLHEDYLIENRHNSPELQEAYDRRFGVVLKK